MEDNTKRLIVMLILAYAIGTFIFAAGLMTKTAVSIILFYIIASILIICGILALYNNYKKNHQIKLYLYLIVVGIVFLFLNTTALINNL
ncbi:MAG: hypothetical protein PHC59_02445 [Thomasclavelia ramosa]|nr:hypothetical protein [Thomasclavelia ramosa]